LAFKPNIRLETYVIDDASTLKWAHDGEAFDALYRENAPRLRAFLRQAVGSYAAAEDLTQEIFTQLWTNPEAFDPARGTIRAYLFGVGRHRAADWWRSSRPQVPLPEDQCASGSPERRSIMADALERLPEDQRTLLWLREVEGQSYAELAVIFSIPVGTVRSRLFMARHALQEIWLGAIKEKRYEVR
jgi:RNA polymerase sigma-70 factor (ECF subfamily)